MSDRKKGEPRRLEIPPGFEGALARCEAARTVWGELPPSHRKGYLDWIGSAKKEDTRRRRIEKAIVMLAEKGK